MRRTVAILLLVVVYVLDIAGPFVVFSVADAQHEKRLFNVMTVAAKQQITTAHGLMVVPEYSLESLPGADLLIVPGGFGTRALLKEQDHLDWISERAAKAEVVASVCTGALLLGACGLLDGLNVTTHHGATDLLRQVAPRANVDPTKRFHDNGKVLTAAGISAGIDLSLHLAARLHGADVATKTARHMEYLGDWRSADL